MQTRCKNYTLFSFSATTVHAHICLCMLCTTCQTTGGESGFRDSWLLSPDWNNKCREVRRNKLAQMEAQQLSGLFLVLVVAFYIVCIYHSQEKVSKWSSWKIMCWSPWDVKCACQNRGQTCGVQIAEAYKGQGVFTLQMDHSKVCC